MLEVGTIFMHMSSSTITALTFSIIPLWWTQPSNPRETMATVDSTILDSL